MLTELSFDLLVDLSFAKDRPQKLLRREEEFTRSNDAKEKKLRIDSTKLSGLNAFIDKFSVELGQRAHEIITESSRLRALAS